METITDCKQPLAFQLFCHLFVISMAVITCIIVYSYLYLYIKKKKNTNTVCTNYYIFLSPINQQVFWRTGTEQTKQI